MGATLIVHGTIRQVTPKARRTDGEVVGQEVSVLTEVGTTLGETLRVMVWKALRPGEAAPRLDLGRVVNWVVDVDADRFGLSGTYRREVADGDLRLLGVSGAWDVSAPVDEEAAIA